MRTVLLPRTMMHPLPASFLASTVRNESEATMSFQSPLQRTRYASISLVYSMVGLMAGLITAAFGLPVAGMTISCMLIGAVVGIVVARSAG